MMSLSAIVTTTANALTLPVATTNTTNFSTTTLLPTILSEIVSSTTLTSTATSTASGTSSVNSAASIATRTAAVQLYAAHSPASMTRQRKRHSKRHSNWADFYLTFNENSTALEWANPCGGYYVPSASLPNGGRIRRKKPKQVYKVYNVLKKAASHDYSILKAGRQDIDISNMQIWFIHNYNYKFLPKLKMNSSIALKRWYRNMQTYVASFAYLRRTQLKWDHKKPQHQSGVADELKDLFISSRSILCELETAVNNTHPYPRRGERQLQQITRAQMNKRLKLRTKRRMEPNADAQADTIDLKFVKYYYYEYLETMWKVLQKFLRNTKRKGQHAEKHNRKEFNEVEKQQRSSNNSGISRVMRNQGKRTPRLKSLARKTST